MGEPTTYEPPRRIRGWRIEATCPDCGHVLEHVADGRPDATTSRAKARCTGCSREYLVEVTLSDVTRLAGPGRRLVGPGVYA